ncbi:MAG: KEOPS complex subunit Pcc1 [Candidatus Bathyarchaeia archaeon]
MNRGRLEVDATIRIRYDVGETARAVWRAITPDNLQVPDGIALKAEADDRELRISVTCARGIGSLIATIDDLLSCIQAAERALTEVAE